jgi:capsular polysaccharide transport system permease protein
MSSRTGAVELQLRVIAALMRREMRAHFGEARLGYLWAVIEPILHLTILAVLFDYVLKRHNPLGGSLNLFMMTGLLPYFLYYKLATYLAGAVEGNRSLLSVPVIKPLDVFVSRALLEVATHLLVGLILFGGIAMIGDADEAVPHAPLQLVLAVAATAGLGFGAGCTNAVIRIFLRNWTAIFGLLLSPLFLLSGIWFLPNEVPQPFRDYLLLNPVMHLIMWVRSTFYPGYEPAELDRTYAAVWSIAAVLIGLALLRVSRRKLVEPT